MASVIITPAAGYAIDIEQVHQQCRIDDEVEDAYIAGVLIPGVCGLFEQETGCKLLTTVIEDRLPCWPGTGRIDLRWGQLQAVASISYLDVAGDLQVLDPGLYQVDATTLPGEVHRAPGKPLPAMLQHPSALRVRYSAGFGDTAEAVPPNARLWLLAHVAHFVANREATASKLDPLPFVANLIAAWQRVSI